MLIRASQQDRAPAGGSNALGPQLKALDSIMLMTAYLTAGVEMEALTAASTAALTIYDMCKAVSRRLVISSVVLESKHGGKSGTYIRSEHGTEP